MKNEEKIVELLSELVKKADQQEERLSGHSLVLDHIYEENKSTNAKIDRLADKVGELNTILKEEVFKRLQALELRIESLENKS
jgi:hypothetical protein